MPVGWEVVKKGGGLVATTTATGEPVTLSEAKLHLKVDVPDDDDLITEQITSSRQQYEFDTGRTMMNTTFRLDLDEFPNPTRRTAYSDLDGNLRLPGAPLSSVTSITYTDTDGVTQTVATTVYAVDTASEPGRVSLKFNQVWPTPRDIENAVSVTFVAGYGTAASSVPRVHKTGIKLLLGNWYESREAVAVSIGGNIVEIPLAYQKIVWGQRVGTFGY